jgi:hypothetical protein
VHSEKEGAKDAPCVEGATAHGFLGFSSAAAAGIQHPRLSQKQQRGASQHPKLMALGETGPSVPAVTR